MKTIKLGANTFSYDEAGQGSTLLLLSGWCQDHRLFKFLAPELARTNRVIRLDWRGHDPEHSYDGDFTTADQAEDVLAFLDALAIGTVVPVSTSHGGWANLEVCDRAGAARIPRSVVIDWIMSSPDDSFFRMIDDLQVRGNWETGREDFFNRWIGNTENTDIINHVNEEMASFDFEMWARSGREIAVGYRGWGNPMQRMAALKEPRPITHVYSQPMEAAYTEAQKQFATDHPWFHPVKLDGKTHFPTLEQPKAVAECIRQFLAAHAEAA